jgi:hypothetical protein
MNGISTITWAAWVLSVAVQICLLATLLYRRHARRFPAFTIYAAGALLQSAALLAIYNHWGFDSLRAFYVSWGLQGLITILRLLAILELCRALFRAYRGIWVVISRGLVLLIAVVTGCAMLFGSHKPGVRIVSADGAMGLALASAVVALFLLARYYRVQAREPIRAMAIGFFLYSCFLTLNDTILQTWLSGYGPLWNFLGIVAFIGTVLVWFWALRRPYPQEARAPKLLPASVYQALSPEVNLRLRALNERLSRLTGQPVERP